MAVNSANSEERSAEFLELCRDVATFCKREFGRIRAIPDDERLELLVVLYARVLEHYLAVVETAMLGLRAPARVVARCLLEASFYFRAIQNGKVTPEDLVKEHTAWRLKLINKLKSQFPTDLRDGLEITKELREEILGMVAEKLSLEEVARGAEAHDEYLVFFERLSTTVHVRKSDLRTQFRRTKSGAPELVVTSDEIEVPTIAMAASTVVQLATKLAEEYGRDVTPEVAIFLNRLRTFTGQ